jgi:low affinity Fe/Cu permease
MAISELRGKNMFCSFCNFVGRVLGEKEDFWVSCTNVLISIAFGHFHFGL